MTEYAQETSCRQNDQVMLNKLYDRKRLGTDAAHIRHDGIMINSQHTREFEHKTAFEHGRWWMTKNWLPKNLNATVKAYVNDVPFLGAPAPLRSRTPARSPAT